MKTLFTILSIVCYLFAAADFLLFWIVDIDLTGVSWSPYVAGALGYLFTILAEKVKPE